MRKTAKPNFLKEHIVKIDIIFKDLIELASKHLGNIESKFKSSSIELFNNLKLSNSITINMDKKTKRAYVNYDKNTGLCKINFDLDFLVYLWCVNAYIAIFYKYFIIEPGKKYDAGIQIENIELPNNMLQLYTSIFQFGLKQTSCFINDWPESFPNPTNIETDKDMSICASCYIYSINFILAHELGHVYLQHFQSKLSGIALENEADNFAFTIMHSSLNQNPKELDMNINLGIVSGLCSILLFHDPLIEKSTTHPYSIDRIKHFINYFKSKNPETTNLEVAILSGIELGLRHYKHNIDFDGKTSEEMINNLFNSIETLRC